MLAYARTYKFDGMPASLSESRVNYASYILDDILLPSIDIANPWGHNEIYNRD